MPVAVSTDPPKRADARKNIAAILDAATDCLARDPEVSVGEIAKAAGLGRVTLYAHFESRAALVAAVANRAIEQTNAQLAALDLSGDATTALSRLLEATWHLSRRFGAVVVAAEQALPREQIDAAHGQLVRRTERVVRRGRRAGAFRTDMPLSWQVMTIQSVLHGALSAVHADQLKESDAPALFRRTVLAVLATPASGAQEEPGVGV